MPQAPTAPVEGTSAGPVVTSPTPALDAAMDAAFAAANEQASEQAKAAETLEADVPEAGATTEDPTDESVLDEGGEGTPDGQQTRPSRREAGRLAEQLAKVEAEKREIEQRFQQRLQVDQTVREKYAKRLGTPEELADLNRTIADPETDWSKLEEARTRLREINIAQDELAPIYQSVEKAVLQHFTAGLETLRDLEGMTEEDHKALFESKSGVDAMRLIHSVGARATAAKYEPIVEKLKTEIKSLRTGQVARGAQPVSGSGASVPTPSGVDTLMKNGMPTDAAIQDALAGNLLGRDLSTAGR